MIYNLFGFDFFIDLQTFQLLLYCAIIGNIFRLLLSFVHNQYWTRTRLQFLNFSFLPAITFIITKIIAGNIALSLGMVGALSIVRLRTPVKNPFELVSYFYLITLGIITSVNPNIAINFLLATFLISLLIELSNKYLKKYFNKYFNNEDSFKLEDENQATLMINTKKRLNEQDLSLNPANSSYSDGEYKYTFISHSQEDLNLIVESIDKKNLNSYFIENINT
tara:strand:- start:3967 stop:4632 length:666 start_codon:yes stop_codon:yes gene_type:complete